MTKIEQNLLKDLVSNKRQNTHTAHGWQTSCFRTGTVLPKCRAATTRTKCSCVSRTFIRSVLCGGNKTGARQHTLQNLRHLPVQTRMETFAVALCAYMLGNTYLAVVGLCIVWCVRDSVDDSAAVAYAV